MIYSSHIFLFPFQWRIPDLEKSVFSEQIDLGNIRFSKISNWENVVIPLIQSEQDDLYNEKNYFFEFVHSVLYDTGNQGADLIRHFERKEPHGGNVFYKIGVKGREFRLKVDAINLNFYSTGIGVLSFYLINDRYAEESDVLKINQFGRRLYPPFIADIQNRNEIADYLELEGLNGSPIGYREDFTHYTTRMSNTPAAFIQEMIRELATNITIKAVIDDRMYVMSIYRNDGLAKELKENLSGFLKKEFWYKYVFVDAESVTCQNDEMFDSSVKKATYLRWQKWKTVYGMSRYSLMMLTNNDCPDFLINYFQTIYVRMAELVLVQRASLLRFSSEVTSISALKWGGESLSGRVSDLYQEYIRFVNQIHFREVSAQDQGIEIYNMLYDKACIEKEVEKLDHEIEELHNHVSLIEDRKNSKMMDYLTMFASIFLPVTIISGVLGMNIDDTRRTLWSPEALLILSALLLSWTGCMILRKRINKRR